MKSNVYFVTGIDTDIGKTFATGFLAKLWNDQGQKTITQKLIQTGNIQISEDILVHRKLMQIGLLAEDLEKWTMPIVLSYPASPHLAAKLENKTIKVEQIYAATSYLSEKYDAVLLEGAGGLMVPLTEDFLTIDYIQQHNFPVVLVTSGRLGSINHTLLSLNLLQQRGINLFALAYNTYHDSDNEIITYETIGYLKKFIQKNFPQAQWINIPNFLMEDENDKK